MNWFTSSVPKRPWLWSLLLTLVSLIAGVTCFIMADFGQPLWMFAPPALWLVTAGLPSTMGVLLVASVWGKVDCLYGLKPFLVCASVIAFALQAVAVRFSARLIRGRLR
jgi:hypothetical protein